jgi:hypothetical protein
MKGHQIAYMWRQSEVAAKGEGGGGSGESGSRSYRETLAGARLSFFLGGEKRGVVFIAVNRGGAVAAAASSNEENGVMNRGGIEEKRIAISSKIMKKHIKKKTAA